MTTEQLKQLVSDASQSIAFSHSISFDYLADKVCIAIPNSTITEVGWPCKEVRILVNLPNFEEMRQGKFNLLFIYNIKTQ